MKKFLLFAAFSGLTAVAAFGSSTANTTMTASADVTNNCVISAGSLSFGSYDPVSGNATSAQTGSATLTVTCTNGAAATITLGQGSNPDSGGGSTDAAPLRRLKAGTDYLNYSLYSDSGRQTVWGNTAGTGAAYSGTGLATSVTVFGQIAAGQTSVHAGSFSDTVAVTITF